MRFNNFVDRFAEYLLIKVQPLAIRQSEISVLEQFIVVLQHSRRFSLITKDAFFDVSVQVYMRYVKHLSHVLHDHFERFVELNHAIKLLTLSMPLRVLFVKSFIKLAHLLLKF